MWSYDWLCACLNFHLICVGMHFKTHPMKKHRRYFFDSFMKCHLKANDEIFKQTLCISTKLINWGNIIYVCWLEWVRVCDNMRIDMAMGRVGYGYCLLNLLSRLLNISPYSYPILDGFEFIVSFSYPLGIGYPQPRFTHHLEKKICKKILKFWF